jgi:hypothetical protein
MAADLFEELVATRAPLLKVRHVKFIGRAGEDQIGNLQIVHGPIVRVRFCVNLLTDPKRRFSNEI